ncbi:hypothetical protein [Pseudonocardia sp. ICBG1293]|uniref:hypothetical protein n=1 Tax=Pseudonocardia sp. ICBG1293 TaxID=2844382 RepID=UPI001CCF1A0C|nr:hypothetical protein [Pseudonocardia sp. ICBG1293]
MGQQDRVPDEPTPRVGSQRGRVDRADRRVHDARRVVDAHATPGQRCCGRGGQVARNAPDPDPVRITGGPDPVVDVGEVDHATGCPEVHDRLLLAQLATTAAAHHGAGVTLGQRDPGGRRRLGTLAGRQVRRRPAVDDDPVPQLAEGRAHRRRGQAGPLGTGSGPSTGAPSAAVPVAHDVDVQVPALRACGRESAADLGGDVVQRRPCLAGDRAATRRELDAGRDRTRRIRQPRVRDAVVRGARWHVRSAGRDGGRFGDRGDRGHRVGGGRE